MYFAGCWATPWDWRDEPKFWVYNFSLSHNLTQRGIRSLHFAYGKKTQNFVRGSIILLYTIVIHKLTWIIIVKMIVSMLNVRINHFVTVFLNRHSICTTDVHNDSSLAWQFRKVALAASFPTTSSSQSTLVTVTSTPHTQIFLHVQPMTVDRSDWISRSKYCPE